eukprot:2089195-Alexandrium_andersonii.AAC.1
MSASLVGSEMCIRDRSYWGPIGPRSAPERRSWQMRPTGQGEVQRVCPVSYTHLTLPTICSV